MIIQPSQDATTESTNQVYDKASDLAISALLLLLNRNQEKLSIESINDSGLTVERVEEISKLANKNHHRSELTDDINEDYWLSSSTTKSNSDRVEVSKVEPPQPEESTRLLYGMKDGQLVNHLSLSEALAVAAMVNSKPGSTIVNGANLRIKFNGQIIAQTDEGGYLIKNEVFSQVDRTELIEFNRRIAQIAENSQSGGESLSPAVTAVAQTLDRSPPSGGKIFLQKIVSTLQGVKPPDLTPEQTAIKEELARSKGKEPYAFKNLPLGNIGDIKKVIDLAENNSTNGESLTLDRGYTISSRSNANQTVTYQLTTPDGEVAIRAIKTPATGMISIDRCQLKDETRQWLKDLPITLVPPTVKTEQKSVQTQASQPLVETEWEIPPMRNKGPEIVSLYPLNPEQMTPIANLVKKSIHQFNAENLPEVGMTKVFDSFKINVSPGANNHINYLIEGRNPEGQKLHISATFERETSRIKVHSYNLDERDIEQWHSEFDNQRDAIERDLLSPNGDVRVQVVENTTNNMIEVQDVRITQAATERWNDLEHEVKVDRAEHSTTEIPTPDRLRASATLETTQNKSAPQSLPDSVQLSESASKRKTAVENVATTQEETTTVSEVEAIVPQLDEVKPDTTTLSKKDQLLARGRATKATRAKTPVRSTATGRER